MSVIFVAHSLEVVAHVLSSIDLIVFTLSVSNLEGVVLHMLAVFAEVSTDERTILLSVEVGKSLLVEETNTNERENLPAEGHTLEVGNSQDGLHAEPDTSEPSKRLVSLISTIQSVESVSISEGKVVGKQVGQALIRSDNIESF